jgi:putative transposase
MRKIKFITGEYYHIFSRGVDKRDIFLDDQDKERFFETMKVFNTVESIKSLREYNIRKNKTSGPPLVYFIADSLLSNHFHFIIEQAVDGGISKFMKRILGGYSWYFNHKNDRSGHLFQGPFNAKHIDSNEYLLYVSVYVNLQEEFGDLVAKSGYSSWLEYMDEKLKNSGFCTHKNIVLDQFTSCEEYKRFAGDVLEEIRANKKHYKLLGL